MLAITGLGVFVWSQFFRKQVNLPQGESSASITTINDNGIKTQKDILETGGVKHSVPLDEIIGGGPAKDGIPPIDDPKFVSVSAAGYDIPGDTLGLAVSLNNTNRFYPFNILVWHEIVNDTIDDRRILVTYCPLCLTGVVFDPLVRDERVEFGTSGKLWQSNLVMYDRKTDSLWSQVLGEAIVGEMTGNKLDLIPSDVMTLANWENANPTGEVLSRDTGSGRDYDRDPYGTYYTTPGTYFPVANKDNRLEDKDFVMGVLIDGQAKAYYVEAVKKAGRVEEKFAGKTIIAEHDKSLDVVRIFEKLADGTKQRINPLPGFWFSWVAVHPNTELYK
jgi:hypothetical protein